MEIPFTTQFDDENCVTMAKYATNFVQNISKHPRYSLADSAEPEDMGIDYGIRIITSADKFIVLKFLRRFFFRDEPLNQSIDLIPEGEESTCQELEDYCSISTVDDNLSLIAVSSTGSIIGVLLNGTSGPPTTDVGEPEYITRCENNKFQKILRLLHRVDKEATETGKVKGKVLETRIISVDSNWRGRGIGMALIAKTLRRSWSFYAECDFHSTSETSGRRGVERLPLRGTDDILHTSGTESSNLHDRIRTRIWRLTSAGCAGQELNIPVQLG